MQLKLSSVVVLSSLAFAAGARAQEEVAPSPLELVPTVPTTQEDAEAPQKTTYRIAAGVAHQISTNFDPDVPSNNSGDFSMTRYGISAGLSYPTSNSDLSLSHTLTYEYDDYGFSGTVPFSRDGVLTPANDPWNDSNLLSYSLLLSYRLNRDWSVFGGPTVGVLGESGANWSDAMTYGGMLGVRRKVSPDLSIGLGVIAVTGIEEGVQALPLILVDWKVSDSVRIRNSRPQPGLRGTAGAEVEWEFAPRWTVAGGFAFDRRRFRLDDQGIAPGGVAENSAFPVYARAGYELSEQWSLGAMAGVLLGGQLTLEDNDGHKIGETDYDTAPFVGISVAARF